jgi:putative transposase
MAIKPELLDELLTGCKTPGDVDTLYSQLLQRLINRSLEAEMTAHLGYKPGENGQEKRTNTRNGKTKKTVKGTFGELEIETPRDRDSNFEPQLIKKRQIRLAGMEDKILTLYAKGMTTRDIEHALKDLYGVEISHTVISQVTESVLDEVRAWQNRPLESVYPILWLDGLTVKIHHGKQVVNKAAHVVLGVNLRGEKEVLVYGLPRPKGPSSGSRCSPNCAIAVFRMSTLPAWMGSKACRKR